MATSKFIEPTADNFQKLQAEVKEIDWRIQKLEESTCALTAGIKALLALPDSGHLREQIYRLCEQIEERSFDAMNQVNSTAEIWGANFIDDEDRQRISALHAATQSQALHN